MKFPWKIYYMMYTIDVTCHHVCLILHMYLVCFHMLKDMYCL